MVHTVYKSPAGDFTWVDVAHPTDEEMNEIAQQYGLHPTSVQDCLDPEHLPKIETFELMTFVIVRAYDDQCSAQADSVLDLTRKVAIFIGAGFILTIHRTDQPFFVRLREQWAARQNGGKTPTKPGVLQVSLLSEILKKVAGSYDRPLEQVEEIIETFELSLFQDHHIRSLLKDIYFLKRRVSVFKRMLRHLLDLQQKLGFLSDKSTAPLWQDLRERLESDHFYADQLLEDLSGLMNLHISLASQRTNEVIRVLTLFSAFFLPLTFMAGIYGMNFHRMPELHHPLGYPIVLGLMASVAAGIYFWFRRKGWLK